jgi:hypothetical protein
VFHRLQGSHASELSEAVHAPRRLAVKILSRIKIFYLGGNLASKRLWVKESDVVNA